MDVERGVSGLSDGTGPVSSSLDLLRGLAVAVHCVLCPVLMPAPRPGWLGLPLLALRPSVRVLEGGKGLAARDCHAAGSGGRAWRRIAAT